MVRTKRVFLFLFIFSFLLSCNFAFRIEKRKYLRGYHLEVSKNDKLKDTASRHFVKREEAKAFSFRETQRGVFAAKPEKDPAGEQNQTTPKPHYQQIQKPESENSLSEGRKAGRGLQEESSRIHENRDNGSREGLFVLSSLLLGVFAGGAFLITERKARRISYWAKEHRAISRTVITAIHILLTGAGLYLGSALHKNGMDLPKAYTDIAGGLFALGMILYPVRRSPVSWLRHSFRSQKLTEIILGICGFCLAAGFGNQVASDESRFPVVSYIHHGVYGDDRSAALVVNPVEGETADIKNVRPPVGDPPKKITTGMVLGIIACFLFLLASFYALGVLSCSLSCSGYSAASILVLVLGLPLAFFLYGLGVRAILGKENRKAVKEILVATLMGLLLVAMILVMAG